MKRFLSLALLALFCLVANVARADDGPTFTPANGSTVESFSTITIAWDDVCDNGDVTDNKLVVYDADGNKVTQGTNNSCTGSGSGAYYESASITYTLAATVSDPGTYTIDIPAKYFLYSNASGLYQESSAYSLTVTIPGADNSGDDSSSEGGDIEIATTSDGIAITLSSDKITFTHDPISPTWDGYGNGTVVKIYKGDDVVATGTGDGDGDDSTLYGSQDYGNWYFDLTADITGTSGTYKLVVPAGVFYVDHSGSTTNAAIEIEFTIGDGSSSETVEEAAITLVDPAPDADGTLTLENWIGWYDDNDNPTVFTFKTADNITVNKNCTLYWALKLVDGASDSDYPYESYASYDSSTGMFSCELFKTQTFYEGSTYEMTAWVKNGATTLVDEMTILTIYGATSTGDDPRSTVSLISSDPEYYDLNHYEIELEKVQDLPVTLTFDGYVTITATIDQSHLGETYTGNSLSLNATGVEGTADDSGNYYTQWTFTIPASEIGDDDYGGEISVTIEGTDSEGKLLFDSSGYTMLTYSYTITGEVDADLSDYTFTPADGATVAELDSIVIANTNGIAVSWFVSSFDITDEDGEVVATISADDVVVNYESDEEPDENSGQKGDDSDDSWGNAYSVTITLPEAITDDGTYTVTIPYEFFIIGIGDVNTNSPKITLTYTVDSSYVADSGSGEGEESGEGEGNEGDESGNGEGDENGGTETGISAIQAAIANGAEVYTISGQKVSAPVNGVNIVKYADGTVKKVLQK